MRDRVKVFLQLKNYSKTAKVFGLDPATIRKQMQNINHEEVQLIVKQRSFKKYEYCVMCYRPFSQKVKLMAKGQCRACYRYFRYESYYKRDRRLN